MANKTFSTPWYGSGEYWIFDNGQYGEKLEIKHRDHYKILTDRAGNEVGLYFWKENNTGNTCFGGGLFPVCTLTGKKLEIYNELKSAGN